ncbi:Unknown protein sequence [Pseudomonas syringae pv. maculicola]|nr:Unknown protein sequence [Pseudomonas syringae pv. maculicola]
MALMFLAEFVTDCRLAGIFSQQYIATLTSRIANWLTSGKLLKSSLSLAPWMFLAAFG